MERKKKKHKRRRKNVKKKRKMGTPQKSNKELKTLN